MQRRSDNAGLPATLLAAVLAAAIGAFLTWFAILGLDLLNYPKQWILLPISLLMGAAVILALVHIGRDR